MATICIGDEVCVTNTGAIGMVTNSNGHAFKVLGIWLHGTDLAPRRNSTPASVGITTALTRIAPRHVNAPSDGGLGPTIYICNAEDCAFIGSGAAVCEIEELFAEAASCIKVQYTECIKGCGNGVNVRLERTKGEDGVVNGVNSFQRCAEVALRAQYPGVAEAPPRKDEHSFGFKAKMLRTRSDNMRWQALKTSTKYCQDAAVAQKILADAETAEYGAARAEDASLGQAATPSMDRAKRRWQRLREATAKPVPAPTASEEPQQRAAQG